MPSFRNIVRPLIMGMGVPLLWGTLFVGIGTVALPCVAWAQADAECEAWVAKGESLLRQEKVDPALRSQRVAAFAEAARRLAQTLSSTPENSGKYPVMLFRIGLYLFLSDSPADAQIILSECQRHPHARSRDAVWKGQPIASHLRSFTGVRIFASSDGSSGSIGEDSASTEGGMRLWANSSKGSIHRLAEPEPEIPFRAPEKRKLRARIGQTRFPESAQALATRLLTPLGTPVSAQQGRIVVVALGPQDGATRLVEQLAKSQLRVWSELLGRKDAPPQLLVYANLDTNYSEPRAQEFSNAIHGRPSKEREGYYSPLDRSLVLRKGILAAEGKLFLGTAAHELAHALLDADAPNTPHWLNEGMAALLEEQDESGQPLDNYRLYDLLLRIKEGMPLSVRSLVSGTVPNDPRLRDALSRYLILWVYSTAGRAGLQRVYTTLRDAPRTTPPTLLAEVLQVSTEKLDAQFVEFLRSRNIDKLDRRWGALKPEALGPVAPSANGNGQRGPLSNGPMMQQTTSQPRKFLGQVPR